MTVQIEILHAVQAPMSTPSRKPGMVSAVSGQLTGRPLMKTRERSFNDQIGSDVALDAVLRSRGRGQLAVPTNV